MMHETSEFDGLVNELANVPGTEKLFSPYHGADERAATCRENLARYLTQMRQAQPRVLLVSEAYGYRGARLTGVPITSERVMLAADNKFGLFGDGFRQTSVVETGVAENTSSIVWGALFEHARQAPLLWSSIPFHPHPAGNPDKNRSPSVPERRLGLPFLELVHSMFGVELILAVGGKAQATLEELGWDSVPLRHPSRGGKPEFVAGLVAALKDL